MIVIPFSEAKEAPWYALQMIVQVVSDDLVIDGGEIERLWDRHLVHQPEEIQQYVAHVIWMAYGTYYGLVPSSVDDAIRWVNRTACGTVDFPQCVRDRLQYIIDRGKDEGTMD